MAVAEQSSADFRGTLGRYALYGEIAAGGMATVHLARLLGPVGFARTVAIKRLHPHLAKDPDFVDMFLEEARLAARVRHPNVVHTLDVVSEDGELFLVMEYVPGESLSRLVRKTRDAGGRVAPRYVVSMMCGALDGLHAAHEATSERGSPLGMVHRDVSPQNIHVGIDGVARVLDFGIAKATNRVQETRTDQIKGKVAYMSPEQLAKGAIDRRADVYSASVVLWEALTGQRLFKADDVPSLVYSIINDEIRRPSDVAPDLPAGIDAIVMRGLDREASNRWPSARAMAVALETILSTAPPREIGEWVKTIGGDALAWRIDLVHRIESATSSSMTPPLRRDSPSSPIETFSGVVPNAPEYEEIPDIKKSSSRPKAPVPSQHEDDRSTLVKPQAPPMRPPQPSFIEEGTETQTHRRSRLVLPLAAVAAFLILTGGALVAYRWGQLEGEQSGAAPDPSPSASVDHEPAIGIAIAKTAPPAKTVTSASAPVVVVAAPTAAPKPIFIPAPPPPPPKPPVSAKVLDDCENPFVIDNRGIRHPKPHCFKR